MNKLKENDDKSELLILRARHRPQSPIDSIVVGMRPSFKLSAREILEHYLLIP
jgi:hypothetical protein